MKKFIVMICLVTILSSFKTVNTKEIIAYENFDLVNTLVSHEFDYSNIEQKIDNRDYIFIGQVKKMYDIKKFDGSGIQMPYSYYKVDVEKVLKGEIENSNIIITYFGGIVDNKLFIINYYEKSFEEILPLEGEYYLFSVNKVKNGDDEISRLKKDSYIVDSSYSMIYLENYEVNRDKSKDIVKKHEEIINNTNLLEDLIILGDIVFEDDGGSGGSGNDGSTFEKAINLEEGINLEGFIPRVVQQDITNLQCLKNLV